LTFVLVVVSRLIIILTSSFSNTYRVLASYGVANTSKSHYSKTSVKQLGSFKTAAIGIALLPFQLFNHMSDACVLHLLINPKQAIFPINYITRASRDGQVTFQGVC
jgi:hypothetical protein